MPDFVIIGNGAAGLAAARAIRSIDKEGSLLVISKEPHHHYYRTRVAELISGRMTLDGLTTFKPAWYEENKIKTFLGRSVLRIDAEKKTVLFDCLPGEMKDSCPQAPGCEGHKAEYGKLLIASGGDSWKPPIEGADSEGVYVLHSADDALAIRELALKAASEGNKCAVIGGGLLGLEAANALVETGAGVHVIEFMDRLLPRQLDVKGAAALQRYLESKGITFSLGAETRKISPAGNGLKLGLSAGGEVDAAFVLISAGIRSNFSRFEGIELTGEKGVAVNAKMETGHPDIYAAGDVAEVGGRVYGIWPAAADMGRIAGINMAGGDIEYAGTVLSFKLKVAGIDLVSAGELDFDGKLTDEVEERPDEFVYRRTILRDGKPVGIIFLGDVSGAEKVIAEFEA